ncbi:MAG: SH3 domain-containing protein [Azoarcus sp.]|jgi:SH3-like domain-containing protein|nr:SH3 domain-containing protein [Azoarcus sp.]
MSRRLVYLAAAVLPFLASGAALAIDYASVARPAILYDAPSPQGQKLAIVRSGTPVEIVLTSPDAQWVKVRDPSGAISWIEGGALSKQRTVFVTAEQAMVQRAASDAAPPAFAVRREVVLEFVSIEPGGWIKVRHADGSDGYLRASAAWGF